MNIEQLKQDFNRDGCVVIPGFLSPDELDELRRETDQTLHGIQHQYQKSGKFGGLVKNLQGSNPWFAHQLFHGKQVGLIEGLLDDELEPATAAFFDRIPGETGGITPHFDAIGHRSMGATIWIALDRADRGNGCLYYVRGTQKLVLDHNLDLPFDAESEGAFPVEINPGDAAIHSTLTVHWSLANESQRSRRAISYFYWAASSKKGIRRAKAIDTAGSG